MRDSHGNVKCDLCGDQCNKCYYDAYIPSVGCWGYTCPVCFIKYRCRLGTGLGQQYVEGKKVAG